MTSNAKLATVRALLDKAEATTFPEEAASYRAKAEQLMVKYRIEEEQLIASDPTSVQPVYGDTPLCFRSSPYWQQYSELFYYIARHTGIQVRQAWEMGEGGYQIIARTVGYESDLRYAEALFTAARMVFTEKLEPTVNRSLTDQENVYRLRSAGMERVNIADILWGSGSRFDKSKLSLIGRMYKKECEQRGEQPAVSGRGVTGKAYREQYAQQFVGTLASRLYQARAAAAADGGLPELHGRKERVQEAFYTRFPDLRPRPVAGELGSDKAPVQQCQKCVKSKRGACNEHYVPMTRGTSQSNPFSAAAVRGRAAGAAAARHVDLGPAGRGKIGG